MDCLVEHAFRLPRCFGSRVGVLQVVWAVYWECRDEPPGKRASFVAGRAPSGGVPRRVHARDFSICSVSSACLSVWDTASKCWRERSRSTTDSVWRCLGPGDADIRGLGGS